MKTLYLSQRVPYPPNKGEKIRTFHQIKYLLENGHDIFLCCPYAADDEMDLFQQLADRYRVRVEGCKLGPAVLRYFSGLLSHKPLSVSNFYSRQLQGVVDRLVLREKFQNIVCTSSGMAEYIFKSTVLANAKNTPRLVMDFMDLDSDKWRQYAAASAFPLNLIYKRESTLLAKYEEKIYGAFDECFFISEAEVDLFCGRNQCTQRPLAIGNGIDYGSFPPAASQPQSRDPVLIFTGVMDYKPNVDAVLWFVANVWPRVLADYPESRLIIAGMNPAPGVLALAKTRGIEVTGFVEDILPYYHQSDLFIAPLRIARGIQNKILQAFSCGLPVVATSMGAEGIDYTDGGDILIADTPDAFVDSIDSLIKNKNLYQSLKENALRLIRERYSWEAKLAPLAEVLK